jgi:hypothetical protein
VREQRVVLEDKADVALMWRQTGEIATTKADLA